VEALGTSAPKSVCAHAKTSPMALDDLVNKLISLVGFVKFLLLAVFAGSSRNWSLATRSLRLGTWAHGLIFSAFHNMANQPISQNLWTRRMEFPCIGLSARKRDVHSHGHGIGRALRCFQMTEGKRQ
jgi:hypothetical protein